MVKSTLKVTGQVDVSKDLEKKDPPVAKAAQLIERNEVKKQDGTIPNRDDSESR